ncbi:hypothetical protein Ssi03_53650 [Sphaerisporangium siamense]|uniref:YbaB/EbfC family DNA-binding protein n=1 Tax=Sphaerisporangium siamense TaxID=795645 RepID=A0A7W7G9E5_9ACTN|nr:hypothetical protein [Sphaerisporangium siamense]MBB4701257.1 hypothetical protein [Sphaerisporangium siamense]GII87375.1 hypothetical protein Ssi03_53650 [Sphaerisporangium siamense]
MESENGLAKRFDGLLNTSTPFAPDTAEEVRERLTVNESRAEEVSAPAEAVETAASEPEPAPVAEAEPRRRPPSGGSATPPPPPPPPFDALDLFGGAREILAEIGGLTHALRTARQHAEPSTGEDHSGTIAVTLAPDGTFDRLSFRRPWRKVLPFEAFDPAVLEAISNAVLARFTTMLPADDMIRPTTEPPPVPPLRAPAPPDLDAEAVLRQANLLFAEFSTALTTARQEATRAVPTGVEIKSDTGRVTLTLTGDLVTRVATHPSWLRTADETRVTEEFDTAFKAVNQVIGDRSARPATETVPGLRELTKATRELQALTRSLGLLS